MTDGTLRRPRDVPLGSPHTIELPVIEAVDRGRVALRAFVSRASDDGPSVYLGGAIHGDELNGTAIARELIEACIREQLTGAVVIVPVQNPLGLRARTRFAPTGAPGSGTDVYQSFPGAANGDPGERIAHAIYSYLLPDADYVIDMHSSTTGSRNAVYAWIPTGATSSVRDRSMHMAASLGADFLLVDQLPLRSILHNAAATLGKAAITWELGEGGRIDADLVDRGVAGAVNFLREVGILAGVPEPRMQAPIVLSKSVVVRAPSSGVLALRKSLGDRVVAGEVIAAILDPYSSSEVAVAAPDDGYIVKVVTAAAVDEGERIAVLGLQ